MIYTLLSIEVKFVFLLEELGKWGFICPRLLKNGGKLPKTRGQMGSNSSAPDILQISCSDWPAGFCRRG